MSCLKPLKGYRSKEVNESGKRSLIFNYDPKKIFEPDPFKHELVPCGGCINCRLERSKQWALRCVHEASLYEENSFITLTFDDEHLNQRPNKWSLDKTEHQKFLKRLRKKYSDKKIKYYHCGEYGDENGRPHYHTLLFNHDFADKTLWKIKNGQEYYVSKELNDLWGKGYCIIGNVTFESAAYVARYILKKITGKDAKKEDEDTGLTPYEYIDENGKYQKLVHEYTTMSLKPGIANEWFHKYLNDLYPKDYINIKGKKMKIPRYYDEQLRKEKPFLYDEIKEKRLNAIDLEDPEKEPKRLKQKREIVERRVKRLLRTHDKE